MSKYQKATEPTFYFIGVTTGKSSIMRVFPKWAEALGINAVIKGIDLPLHAPVEMYREVVDFLKNDELSLGALVTTHKIDIYNACKDMYDYIDPLAATLHEVSSFSKRDGQFRAHAKDPISSGLALQNFVPENYWKDFDGDVLLLGAGGSSLSMSLYLTKPEHGDDVPSRIIIANRSQPRLDSGKALLDGHTGTKTKMEYILNPTPADNDRTLASLKPHSLIVNATGLGKDAPGSPLTDACKFPKDSLVWEINYRGDLIFKDQAEAQQKEKNLHVEDGWIYFIHGWTQVMEEVFDIKLADKIPMLSEIAKNA
ncbi:MAG: shikimate dehydrogenase family protein [Oscillospiraceae bacterium]